MATVVNDVLSRNVAIFKERASRSAYQGVLVAAVAVIVATLAVAYVENGSLSIDGIIQAQKTNVVLWILDLLPFVFAYMGQYASYVIAQEAGLMVQAQTEELRQRATAMERQAVLATTHDRLTELPTRGVFIDDLDRAILTQDGQASLAVLMVTAENFREVQEILGHELTDGLIRSFAQRLQRWTAAPDRQIARIDTHSFAIRLQCDGSRAGAERVVRELIRSLERSFNVGDLQLTLHPAVGVAFYPEHAEDADSLLQRATVALVNAGRSASGITVYAPVMEERGSRQLTLMADLKRAIERDELMLRFQPKVALADQRLVGVEALVRWEHRKHGFLSPDEFIGLAERSRMIGLLTQWVLRTAFRQARQWRQQGFDFKVAINLSARDLVNPDLPDLIDQAVGETGIDTAWIVLEITESSVMDEPARALAVLERLKGMGFELAIDDFGTGYSSLAYLKQLPVSELKIDKCFVLDMVESENDAVIVRATVGMAHNLGLKVIAEGVEDAKAEAMLREFGCDVGQGYWYAKPLTADELLAWQRARNGPKLVVASGDG